MTFGSLFAGIGGFDLGLERAGMECKWQVEIDPYARRVLEKHWPDVRRWDDVRTFPPDGEWGVDLVCGGFPCQDISVAGKKSGINGVRSGLWSEYARVVGVLRPRFVFVENVANLLSLGIERVLGDLSALGYDCEWEVIPAAAVGAPHLRERVWILADCHKFGNEDGTIRRSIIRLHGQDRKTTATNDQRSNGINGTGATCEVPDPDVSLPQGFTRRSRKGELERNNWWATEPDVGRVANGIPDRVDRLKCLGNAIVPQIAEWIGRRIIEADQLV